MHVDEERGRREWQRGCWVERITEADDFLLLSRMLNDSTTDNS